MVKHDLLARGIAGNVVASTNATLTNYYTKGESDNITNGLDSDIINLETNVTTNYALKSEVTNSLTPKGKIAHASLPTTGNTLGDYYYCSDGDGTNGAGNYVWNGTSWYFGGSGDDGYAMVTETLKNLSSLKVNLCDTSTVTSRVYNGVTITKNGDGSITLDGTPTSTFNLLNAFVYLKAGLAYKTTGDGLFIVVDSSYKQGTVTVNTSGNYPWFIQVRSDLTYNNKTIKPIICVGNTLIDYVKGTSNLDTKIVEFYQSATNSINEINIKYNKTRDVKIQTVGLYDVIFKSIGNFEISVTVAGTKINIINNTGEITQINYTSATYNLAHFGYLVFDLDSNTFKIVANGGLPSLTYNFVMLVWNYYKAPIGQWQYFVTNSQIMTNKNNIAIMNEPVPSYYFTNSYLNNKIANIQTNNRFRSGVTFNFITDMHYPRNTGISKLLLKRVCDNTSVKNTFFGGDIVYAYLTSGYVDCDTMMHDSGKFMQDYSNHLGNKLYQVKGNHDYTVATDSTLQVGTTLSNESIYEYTIRQSENTVVGVQGKFYFYVENKMQKTRFIVIDQYEGETITSQVWGLGNKISQEQYDWLCNVALNVEDYNFIIFTHTSSDSTLKGYEQILLPLHGIMSAINNKTTYEYNQNEIAINVDYTATTSKVICNIAGHAHKDLNNTQDGVLTILTACDSWLSDDGITRTPSTITENAFDVFSIDYTNKTIKTTRIGAGSNREFTYT